MTEQRSPWARPPADSVGSAGDTGPSAGSSAAGSSAAGLSAGPVGHPTGDRPGYRAGTVTRLAPAPPRIAPAGPAGPPAAPEDPARPGRLMLRWFGGAALAVIVTGLVIVLVTAMTGGVGPFSHRASGPSDTRP